VFSATIAPLGPVGPSTSSAIYLSCCERTPSRRVVRQAKRCARVNWSSRAWSASTAGALLDMFKYSMLTSSGEAHRQTSLAHSTRAFAARVITPTATAHPKHSRRIDFRLAARNPDRSGRRLRRHDTGPHHQRYPGTAQGGRPRISPQLVYDVSARLKLHPSRTDDIPQMEAAASQLRDYSEQALTARSKRPRRMTSYPPSWPRPRRQVIYLVSK